MPCVEDPLRFPDYLPLVEYVGCPHCAHPVDISAEAANGAEIVASIAAHLLERGTAPAEVARALRHVAAWAGETQSTRTAHDPRYRALAELLHAPATPPAPPPRGRPRR